MHLGSLIAEGRTAEIYAWGEDQILKLYKPGFSQGMAEYERNCALASENTGYAVPKVGELLTIDGRPGILYQRIEGETMLHHLEEHPLQIRKIARQLAELHADMHVRSASGLPSQKERLTQKINQGKPLDPNTKQIVLDLLAKLPDGDALCHDDFHPDNILMTAEGPIIIDWITATRGHPLADVARTYIIGKMAAMPKTQPAKAFTQFTRKLLIDPYLKRYFQLSPYSPAEMKKWLVPVAAARLSEEIHEETQNILTFIDNSIKKRET